MTFWQAVFIGILQGATELFPVSSLGHAVIIPSLLHWSYKQSDPSFLPFLVLLHIGTAGALFILYWRDWVAIIRGFVRAAIRGRVVAPEERLAMLLVVGTVPTGVVGVFFQKDFQALFANPRAAAAFLVLNGVILMGAELMRRRAERRAAVEGRERVVQEEAFGEIGGLSFRTAALVGVCQISALFPGISRSGATMAGGLLASLRHQEAARFSFLLATPIIAAAGLLEVPRLFTPGIPLTTYVISALLAGLAAYGSARFLIRYFRSGRLDPYAWYCVAVGVICFALLR
ncbi:MAG TPA: undecaprenyl-diphosphate phosphatase [Candidatus Dormibacteraeota bacterium]|nr:undecaprenyl-diphosphate phosphatase [Candidatus Dormibacteraeota bacterium]